MCLTESARIVVLRFTSLRNDRGIRLHAQLQKLKTIAELDSGLSPLIFHYCITSDFKELSSHLHAST